MAGPDLKQHAANGNTVAQTEIDRRAARKAAAGGKIGGKREGVPFSPAPTPSAEEPKSVLPEAGEGHTGTFEELQKSHPMGAQAYSKGFGLGTVVQHHPAKHDNSSVTVDFPGHGLIKRNANDVAVGKDIPAAALAAKTRRDEQQTETDKKLADFQARIDERKKAREAAITAEADKPATPAPAGYSAEATEGYPGQETVRHSASNARVGSTRVGVDYTKEDRPSIYRGYYNGKEVGGAHETREAATKAVAEQHKIELARTEATTTKALADSKKSAQGTPWEARAFEHDSSQAGMAAARKIKQSFKFDNHTLTVEPTLSKTQTASLLSDLHQTITKANLNNETINFHVPTGDKNFRDRRGKAPVLGYVHRGGNTVYVNPKVTTGEKGDNSREVEAGHFMSGAANTSKLQYVLTHEVGHVLDGSHHHTRTPQADLELSGGRKLGLGTTPSSRGKELMQANRDTLSKYGNTSSEEAYAEAYAQWIHGGPGSSKVADEYAKEFGWAPPATTK